MKRLILAGLVTAGALGAIQVSAPTADAIPLNCATVRCMECPPGTVLAPQGNNCCRCKKI